MARENGSILPLHNGDTSKSRPQSQSQSATPSEFLSRKDHHHHRRPHLPHRKTHKRRANLSKLGVTNFYRNEAIAFVAELSGTFMFLFFAFVGTQVANAAAEATTQNAANANNTLSQAPNATTLQYIALSFGFSLTINVWIFYRISGGLFNPVVTLALYLIGAIKAVRGISCFIAQIAGSIAASAVASAILPGSLNIATALGPAVSVSRGLFLEMFLTCELVLAILFLAAEKHKATFLAPIGIGLALFIAEVAGVFYTGGSLNPARSFGPAVVTGTWPGYHWIYWVGPLLGSLLATAFYKLMKYSDYETVNPGQDFNDEEIEHFNPDANAETADDVKRPNPTAMAAQEAIQVATQTAIQEALNRASEEVVRDMPPEQEEGARTLAREVTKEVQADGPGSVTDVGAAAVKEKEEELQKQGSGDGRHSNATTLDGEAEKNGVERREF